MCSFCCSNANKRNKHDNTKSNQSICNYNILQYCIMWHHLILCKNINNKVKCFLKVKVWLSFYIFYVTPQNPFVDGLFQKSVYFHTLQPWAPREHQSHDLIWQNDWQLSWFSVGQLAEPRMHLEQIQGRCFCSCLLLNSSLLFFFIVQNNLYPWSPEFWKEDFKRLCSACAPLTLTFWNPFLTVILN